MEKVVVTRKLPGDAVDKLRESFDVSVSPHDRNLSYEELREFCNGAAGVISMLSDRIDRQFFESHPELKVVSNYAVGYNNIDLDAAASHGGDCHQYSRRAHRGHRRYRVGADHGCRAADCRSRPVYARRGVRRMGAGDVSRPGYFRGHAGHCRHGTDRPGHRKAGRWGSAWRYSTPAASPNPKPTRYWARGGWSWTS